MIRSPSFEHASEFDTCYWSAFLGLNDNEDYDWDSDDSVETLPNRINCYVCGKLIIMGEEGNYHPVAQKPICALTLKDGCQRNLLMLQLLKSNIEKKIALRHSICNNKQNMRVRKQKRNL